jgi:acetyl-CoA carboxylase biotin carboxyl carrier protein
VAIVAIRTEIAGSVWKVLAKVGQTVAEEEPILLLESMKMEIPVAASEAGTVEEILVEEGDVVTEGAIVARLKV